MVWLNTITKLNHLIITAIRESTVQKNIYAYLHNIPPFTYLQNVSREKRSLKKKAEIVYTGLIKLVC